MIMVIRIVIMVFTIISPITLGVIFGFCGRKITNLKEAITNLAIVFSISLAQTEASPPCYNYANVLFYNCAGQACAWVEAGGLMAPYPPSSLFLHPAPSNKKGYFMGRRSSILHDAPTERIVGKNYNPLEH